MTSYTQLGRPGVKKGYGDREKDVSWHWVQVTFHTQPGR